VFLERCSLLVYLVEFIFNATTVKTINGIKVNIRRDIIKYYATHGMAIDLMLIALLTAGCFTNYPNVLNLLFLVKIPSLIERIEGL